MQCDPIVVKGDLTKMKNIRTYRELKKLRTFEERYQYLQVRSVVGQDTFGYDRYLNQLFYTTRRWRKTRDGIIIRDNGCDLGIEGYEIYGKIVIHHLNPITIDDIELDRDVLYDPEFLISTTHNTHLAIHYGDERILIKPPVERRRNDTCPWK